MRDSVAKAFVPFNSGKPPFKVNLEGYLTFMYLDVGDITDPSKPGLVTTGMGNLIDPIELALSLPWVNPDGSPASQDVIRSQWQAVKSRQDMKSGGGSAYEKLTTIRLTVDGVKTLIARKLLANEDALLKQFPSYPSWNSDAQLGIHSLSWARGPNNYSGAYPSFYKALNQSPPDFTTAAKESRMYNGTKERNDANFKLFQNAAAVQTQGLDPDILWYPGEPGSGGVGSSGGGVGAAVSSAVSAVGSAAGSPVAAFKMMAGLKPTPSLQTTPAKSGNMLWWAVGSIAAVAIGLNLAKRYDEKKELNLQGRVQARRLARA